VRRLRAWHGSAGRATSRLPVCGAHHASDNGSQRRSPLLHVALPLGARMPGSGVYCGVEGGEGGRQVSLHRDWSARSETLTSRELSTAGTSHHERSILQLRRSTRTGRMWKPAASDIACALWAGLRNSAGWRQKSIRSWHRPSTVKPSVVLASREAARLSPALAWVCASPDGTSDRGFSARLQAAGGPVSPAGRLPTGQLPRDTPAEFTAPAADSARRCWGPGNSCFEMGRRRTVHRAESSPGTTGPRRPSTGWKSGGYAATTRLGRRGGGGVPRSLP
jgi:hypothetical protein